MTPSKTIQSRQPRHLARRLAGAALAWGLWVGIGTQPGLPIIQGADAAEAKEKTELMFVQTAEDLQVDAAAGTLRLVKVNPQTLYFSDRPVRLAGHIRMADYLEEWKKGKDNFGEDPPNATLSVYEPGQADNTLAVVVLTDPIVDGPDLLYHYRQIEGTMPNAGGQTALFIDWIGPGGGVGVGFHGVGVGRRGPGWR